MSFTAPYFKMQCIVALPKRAVVMYKPLDQKCSRILRPEASRTWEPVLSKFCISHIYKPRPVVVMIKTQQLSSCACRCVMVMHGNKQLL